MRFSSSLLLLGLGMILIAGGIGHQFADPGSAVSASAPTVPMAERPTKPEATTAERSGQGDAVARDQKRVADEADRVAATKSARMRVAAEEERAAFAKAMAEADRGAVAAAMGTQDPRAAAERIAVAIAAADERKLLQTLTDRLRSAKYAYNYPEEMYLTRRSQITLTLAASDDAAVQELQKQFGSVIEGKTVAGTTKYAPVMTATLRGRDFKIEPAESQRKFVLLEAKEPVQWTWFVEPLETGPDKILLLELAANFQHLGPTAPSLPVQTFQARIHVQVGTFDRFMQEARRMTPVAQTLSGVGALLTIFGFFGTARNWLAARRQPRSPKNTGT